MKRIRGMLPPLKSFAQCKPFAQWQRLPGEEVKPPGDKRLKYIGFNNKGAFQRWSEERLKIRD